MTPALTRRIALALSSGLVAALFALTGATAATIQVTNAGYCRYSLEGPIETGDLERLQSAVESGDTTYAEDEADPEPWQPLEPGLCLNSQGGPYTEGVKIARYLVESGIPTIVDDGAECYSACAIVWLGGSVWADGAFPSRYVHVNGKLGFHAPFNPNTLPEGRLPSNIVQLANDSAYAALGELLDIPLGSDYTDDIVPIRLLSAMLKNGPENMATAATVGDAMQWKLELIGYTPPADLTREQLCEACNHMVVSGGGFANDGPCTGPFKTTKAGYRAKFSSFGAEGLYSCVVIAKRQDGVFKELTAGLVEEGENEKDAQLDYLPVWWTYGDDESLQSLAK